MVQARWQVPETSELTIRETSDAGRAVFAKSNIEPGTPLLSTSPALSPLCHVILRPYRREVCAQCFLYDRGQDWKIRDTSLGIAFCSQFCEDAWQQENNETCQAALLAVEKFIKASNKRQSKSQVNQKDSQRSQISEEAISNEWQRIEILNESVLRARLSDSPSKIQRALLRNTQDLTPDADILTYALSGVLAVYRAQKMKGDGSDDSNTAAVDAAEFLPSLYQLASDDHVFVTTPTTSSPLEDYTSAYLVLSAILPTLLLKILSTNLIINLASRASHNAFSIRPEGTTDGDQSGEFLGWGVWPEASFFNHSCRPNVTKERKGRVWTFSASSESELITVGQQLCITYLGGDEKDLNVHERRKRLQEQWGFLCQCDLCQQQSAEAECT